jgi:hypothetical protein
MLGWAAKNVPIGRLERTSGARRILQPKYKIDRIAIGIRGQQKNLASWTVGTVYVSLAKR